MNYKLMLPILLSVSVISAIDKQEIETQLFQKQTELSELRELIIKRSQAINVALENMKSQINAAAVTLSAEELDAEQIKIGESVEEFLTNFYAEGRKGNIKSFLREELSVQNSILCNTQFNFDSVKFSWISSIYEYHLLKQLIEKYTSCLQVIFDLHEQLKNSND